MLIFSDGTVGLETEGLEMRHQCWETGQRGWEKICRSYINLEYNSNFTFNQSSIFNVKQIKPLDGSISLLIQLSK